MMHLYRHFKLNQTRPAEHLEHEQADTIKSILSKSKMCFSLFMIDLLVWERVARRGESGSWLSNPSARQLQSTSSMHQD